MPGINGIKIFYIQKAIGRVGSTFQNLFGFFFLHSKVYSHQPAHRIEPKINRLILGGREKHNKIGTS
jgi:hypothetical protein